MTGLTQVEVMASAPVGEVPRACAFYQRVLGAPPSRTRCGPSLRKGVAFARFDGMLGDELGIWVAPPGDLVAWFFDSEGNTLSLTQEGLSVSISG